MQVLSKGRPSATRSTAWAPSPNQITSATSVDFDDHGMKKFVTSIWSAELIGEPPADRPVRRRGRRKAVKK